MSRCIACNKGMSLVEVMGSRPDGEPEDMCAMCRHKAKDKFNWVWEYEHAFASETDLYSFIERLKLTSGNELEGDD